MNLKEYIFLNREVQESFNDLFERAEDVADDKQMPVMFRPAYRRMVVVWPQTEDDNNGE